MHQGTCLTSSQALELMRTGSNLFPDTDVPVSAFNFSRMESGRIFAIAGEQYRYLEDMGEGNHMIIQNVGFPMLEQSENWYESLEQNVHDIVQPITVVLGSIPSNSITWQNDIVGWIPNNVAQNQSFLTTINEENGSKQAFDISLADVARLSENGVFSTPEDRIGGDATRL